MSNKQKEQQLRKAALEGDLDSLNSVLSAGVNLEAPHPKVRGLLCRSKQAFVVCSWLHNTHTSAQDGQTALMYASANGHLDAMQLLLSSGAKLEGADKVCTRCKA